MISPILDTHIWLWWILDSKQLSEEEKKFLNTLPADKRPFLCDISLWELGTLIQKERLILDCPLDEFLMLATHPNTVRVLSIHPAAIIEMVQFPASFHQDPADRLIVATSKALKIPLWTQDRLIHKSKLTTFFKIK